MITVEEHTKKPRVIYIPAIHRGTRDTHNMHMYMYLYEEANKC